MGAEAPSTRRPDDPLARPVQYLKGVGPQRALALGRLDVVTVADLLHYYPRAWEDRRETPAPGPPPAEGPVVFRGRVLRARVIPAGIRLTLFRATLGVPAWDATVEAVWFKRPSRRYDVLEKLRAEVRPGADLWIVARAEPGLLRVREAQVEEHYAQDDPRAGLHVGRVVPVYSLTEGLTHRFMRETVSAALAFVDKTPEPLPPRVLQKRSFLAAPQALAAIHYPRAKAEHEAARRRLAYEELLLLELAWVLKHAQTRQALKGFGYEIQRRYLTPFREHLGFELTHAQKRVINEIFSDMQAEHPMTRLLQGDVGSGKTVIAIAALLLAAENGAQGAFMAPTEILAEQHHWTLAKFLAGLPLKTALLTSRVPKREREKVLAGAAEGSIDIVLGTHALLEGDVRFKRLRLAVIDEQHRFGVRQRTTLRQKGPPMDLLLMTATPIPRTLALALYGDLNVSTLDEMPPGRAPVRTRRASEAEALAQARREVASGHQAYIVYPIIEESSRLDLKAAEAEFERLREVELRGLRVDLVHGQMPGKRKAQAMERFAAGATDVLVATPVIEVGVDVPNATVMVVQNADRFGLASLHQLRGRIGRGSSESQCLLVAEPKTPEARRRLDTLCESADGFRIAEEDLKLRGPGEVLGTAQHGALMLRLANLIDDADLLAQAREDAEELLASDPDLSRDEHAALRRRLLALYQKRWHAIDLA
ncbi:MAG: ATP-dependent DNA helicase RecG [Elusimicrobia bacterium]|nr:ATP-dependent DNA helicase RecG [Elusimicrobiota bacterium]